MQRYKDWPPGPGDTKGKGIHHLENPYMFNEWRVAPIIKTRDACHLDESNWDCVIKQLEEREGEHEDYEVLSFNHWACGWFDMIVVKPGTGAHIIMNAIETSLENHPALDEDDWFKREADEHHDVVLEACHEAIDYAMEKEDVRTHFDLASDDSFKLKLCGDFSPLSFAGDLGWDYSGRTPTNEDVYDALLESGDLEVEHD